MENNVYDELVSLLIIFSVGIVVFFGFVQEDEFVQWICLEFLVWVMYVNYGVFIFVIIFIYGFLFFWVIVVNMFMLLLFFIVCFYWMMYCVEKEMNYEE